jgi:hypothetical protein
MLGVSWRGEAVSAREAVPPAADHTPGPWRAIDHETEPCRVYDADGNMVADVFCTDMPGGTENARLIAAAPDLLAACKVLVNEVLYLKDDGTLPSGVENHPAMFAARAAILKAEGK